METGLRCVCDGGRAPGRILRFVALAFLRGVQLVPGGRTLAAPCPWGSSSFPAGSQMRRGPQVLLGPGLEGRCLAQGSALGLAGRRRGLTLGRWKSWSRPVLCTSLESRAWSKGRT